MTIFWRQGAELAGMALQRMVTSAKAAAGTSDSTNIRIASIQPKLCSLRFTLPRLYHDSNTNYSAH
jgi:hypothetical protein